MKIHIHKWEIVKKGHWNRLIPAFIDTVFACECGKFKKEFCIKNYKKAGYTRQEFELLLIEK